MDYTQNTKANLPDISQTYSSVYDNHPIYSRIGGYVCDKTTGALKYKLDKMNWAKKADGAPSNLTGTDGDVMTMIPAFYFKATTNADGTVEFEIDGTIPDTYGSNGRVGFSVHPAFLKSDGTVKPYFLWGSYKAYSESGTLRSISGVLPSVSKTKATFLSESQNGRNTKYALTSFMEQCAIMLLFWNEFGNLNSQSVCGRGIVDMSWEEGLTTTPEKRYTGGTNSLGDRSGYIDNGSGNGKSSMRYRGIEDFWGNVWEFRCGLLATDDGWYYTNEHSKFDVKSSMKHIPISLTPKVNNGYITDMLFQKGLEYLFLPKSTGGSENTYYSDYFYSHDVGEENIALASGNWNHGSFAGVSCLACGHAASASISDIGARLSYSDQ